MFLSYRTVTVLENLSEKGCRRRKVAPDDRQYLGTRSGEEKGKFRNRHRNINETPFLPFLIFRTGDKT